MTNLYERLESEAKKRGKTLYGLCSELGISKGALSNLKNGISKSLSTKTLNKFADALGVSIGYLVNGNENDEIEPNFDEIKIAFLTGLDEKPTEEKKEIAIEIIQKLVDMMKE